MTTRKGCWDCACVANSNSLPMSRWCLQTRAAGQPPLKCWITLAVLDNPKNVGFPTYWHARGYGLFSANPLGQEVFSNGKEKLNFTLESKQSVTFRYRLLLLSGPTTPG